MPVICFVTLLEIRRRRWYANVVIHSLGDKRLKSSLLALTPCALTCCLLNQKQVTLPPVTKLWARAPAPWLHPYLHPSLEWFCFDSFWAPWWYSQGETLFWDSISLHASPQCAPLCLNCLPQNPGQGAGDGLYFFSGILYFPSWVTQHSFHASSEPEGHFAVKLLAA